MKLKEGALKFELETSVLGPRSCPLKADVLLRRFHATVSFIIFVSLISVTLVLPNAYEESKTNAFLRYGLNNLMWLFSVWMSVTQIIYFNLYFVMDILNNYGENNPHYKRWSQRLDKLASYMLFALIFPLSPMVTIYFWTFYHLRREAIWPEVMDRVFPRWLNHMMHTLPSLGALLFLFTSNRHRPDRRLTFGGLIAFLAVYFIGVVSCKMRSGKWVYLFMETLTANQVKCFYLFFLIGSILFYTLASTLDRLKIRGMIPDEVTLIRWLHFSVSFVIFMSIIGALVCILITDVDLSQYEFAVRGFKNICFLLSIWVSTFQIICFNLYTVIEIVDIYSIKNPKLRKWKYLLHDIASYLLFTVVFPLSVLVTVLFWTFYHWKRDFMYPKYMDEVFPPLLNHIMHTFPGLLAVVYMFTSNKRVPPKSHTLPGLVGVILAYAACFLTVKMWSGKWAYLVLDKLTPLQLRLTFAFGIVGAITFYFIGYMINEKIQVFRKKVMVLIKESRKFK